MTSLIKKQINVNLTPASNSTVKLFELIEGAKKIAINLGGGMGGGRHEIYSTDHKILDNGIITATNLITGEFEQLGLGSLAYIVPVRVYRAVIELHSHGYSDTHYYVCSPLTTIVSALSGTLEPDYIIRS